MVILFVVAQMAKIPSPFVLSTRAATAWIRTGKKRAATVLAGRGVLRLRLQRLRLQETPPVVVPAPQVLKKNSTSSRLSSGHARGPCGTGGNGFLFCRLSGGVCSSSSRGELGA